jgi:hypothetical protein
MTTLLFSYRSSVAKCCSEITLQPIRSAVTAMGPEIEKETSDCATICKDYDSYQRRLKVTHSLTHSLGHSLGVNVFHTE